MIHFHSLWWMCALYERVLEIMKDRDDLENEEDLPAPTALAACQAWCARLQSPETVRPAP